MSWLARLQAPRINPQLAKLALQPEGGAQVARTAATVANDVPATDPDRWCWPHSVAMNSAELNAHLARVAKFNERGFTLAQAEELADKLLARDRQGLDMVACLECRYCTGSQCVTPMQAGLFANGQRAFSVQPIRDKLQRCAGFKPGVTL